MRTKALTTVTLLFLLPFASRSQDKGYVSMMIGPGFPVGNFAAEDLRNTSAGWAKTGVVWNIGYSYKLGTPGNIGPAPCAVVWS